MLSPYISLLDAKHLLRQAALLFWVVSSYGATDDQPLSKDQISYVKDLLKIIKKRNQYHKYTRPEDMDQKRFESFFLSKQSNDFKPLTEALQASLKAQGKLVNIEIFKQMLKDVDITSDHVNFFITYSPFQEDIEKTIDLTPNALAKHQKKLVSTYPSLIKREYKEENKNDLQKYFQAFVKDQNSWKALTLFVETDQAYGKISLQSIVHKLKSNDITTLNYMKAEAKPLAEKVKQMQNARPIFYSLEKIGAWDVLISFFSHGTAFEGMQGQLVCDAKHVEALFKKNHTDVDKVLSKMHTAEKLAESSLAYFKKQDYNAAYHLAGYQGTDLSFLQPDTFHAQLLDWLTNKDGKRFMKLILVSYIKNKKKWQRRERELKDAMDKVTDNFTDKEKNEAFGQLEALINEAVQEAGQQQGNSAFYAKIGAFSLIACLVGLMLHNSHASKQKNKVEEKTPPSNKKSKK